MEKFWINTIAGILFFYSGKKRKAFRAKHSATAKWNRELRRKGILGANSYIAWGSTVTDKRTRIGKFCSIARNVSIGTTSHPVNFLTTSPVSYKDIDVLTDGLVFPEGNKVAFEHSAPVTIGNDVWIGLNAVIMDGVTVGDGAIIGAGAVVTRDVPPYAVALGIPARVVKYRFDEAVIARLLRVRWWDQPDEVITSLPVNDVEACLKQLESASQPR